MSDLLLILLQWLDDLFGWGEQVVEPDIEMLPLSAADFEN